MPTGGINAQNIAEYAAFSKVIACGGSWMVSKELISSKDFKKIEEESAIALQMVKEARNPKKSPGALTTFSYPKTSTEKSPQHQMKAL